MDSKMLDDLAKKLSNAVPPGLKGLQSDLQQNFKSVLQATFAKFDLVTREEFDAQTKVLARTRAKWDAMEKLLAELEKAKSSQVVKKKS